MLDRAISRLEMATLVLLCRSCPKGKVPFAIAMHLLAWLIWPLARYESCHVPHAHHCPSEPPEHNDSNEVVSSNSEITEEQ